MSVHLGRSRSSDADNLSHCSSVYQLERAGSSQSGDDGSSGHVHNPSSSHGYRTASPLTGLPERGELEKKKNAIETCEQQKRREEA
ncbi:putative receptor-like protein kinase [Nymphaea thermarum]|nr:putative receptor-like protein kinase [Nymphaea thermarum]